MIIETKYGNNDKVWSIAEETETVFIPCSFCNATGEVTGADRTTDECPRCHGAKGKTIWKFRRWRIQGIQLTIGEIQVRIRYKYPYAEDNIEFDNIDNEDQYEEHYMCVETGIGTGQVYDVDNLFTTKKEAEEECTRRNKKDEEDENHTN